MNDDRYLMHYGVKGMKWGVRKDKPSAGGSRLKTAAKIASPVGYALGKGGVKVAKKAASEKRKWDANRPARIEKRRQKALDVKTSARYTYKQRKHLSDAELRSRINRLNMEKQLKDLSKNEGSRVDLIMLDTGQKAARKALGYYGAKTILNVAVPGSGEFVKVPKK